MTALVPAAVLPTSVVRVGGALNSAPYLQRVAHLALALALGLVVGMERERRGKQAGLRTFGFVTLFGGVGGVLGTPFAIVALVFVGVFAALITVAELIERRTIELTTAVALLVMCMAGILSGEGHTLTPTSIALVCAVLLAWKERLVEFTLGLTGDEVRAALLLGVLAFVIYPVLPAGDIGPGQIIDPRLAWVTVLLTATLGFGNYILLKHYGSRGIEITGFFGGLVNSTVTGAELAERTRGMPQLEQGAFRGIMWANCAMAIRNGILTAVIATAALRTAAIPLAAVCITTAAATRWTRGNPDHDGAPPALSLQSPFSLRSALRLGVVFLVLQVAGELAQRKLGHAGLLVISIAGGLVSSASAVASSSALAARHTISPGLAGLCVAVASLASVLSDFPFIRRISHNAAFSRRVGLGLIAATTAGTMATILMAIITRQ